MAFHSLLRALTGRYPLNTPRASLLRMLPDVPESFGDITDKDRSRYCAYPSGKDHVCKSIFWFGDFDPWVSITLKRLACPGTIALDIGANIGVTAIALAKAVGEHGKVYCFEPISHTARQLKQNLAMNGLSWAAVEEIALSDRTANLRMTIPRSHSGMASIADNGCYRVRAMRFDDWLDAHPSALDISVCKIDVEDHEESVFSGMQRTLERKAIPAFVFERHVIGNVSTDAVLTMLEGYGYRVARICKGLSRVFYCDIRGEPRAQPTADFVATLDLIRLMTPTAL